MNRYTPASPSPSVAQALEDHRRSNGQFGQQHRAEVGNFTPPPATTAAAGWVQDGVTPHPTGGYVNAHQPAPNVVEFYNADGRKHRLDGPAVMTAHTHGYSEAFLRDGLLHREDGPAVTQWLHLPGSDRVEVVSAWWTEGKLERKVRDHYTDDLDPGPQNVDGIDVVVHPRHAAPHDGYNYGPAVLPWENADEVAAHRAARTRLVDAQDAAENHPALAGAVRNIRERFSHLVGSPDFRNRTQIEQQEQFSRAVGYTNESTEALREAASDLFHTGHDRADAAQEQIDENSGWLGWLPSRKAARETAQHELESARSLVAAAGAVMYALNKEDK